MDGGALGGGRDGWCEGIESRERQEEEKERSERDDGQAGLRPRFFYP